jgi:hypothetical protein
MGRTCSTGLHVEKMNAPNFQSEIPKERGHLRNTGIVVSIILKWAIVYERVVWSQVAQDGDQCRSLASTIMNFPVP